MVFGLQDASRLLSFFGSGDEGGKWKLATGGKFSIFVCETSSRPTLLVGHFYWEDKSTYPLSFERKIFTAIRIIV